MIKEIVKEIWRKLDLKASIAARGLVGMESRVEEIEALIDPQLNDVRFIGIWGMGGIGKTTIARAVYDNLKKEYDGWSFIRNVREESKKNGLLHLQKKLLSDVLNGLTLGVLGDVDDGVNLISQRLCQKRVLLVLDDVDRAEQLEALARNTNWFGPGSRILITTRDNQLLRSNGVEKQFKVEGLNYDEAFQLFNLKAFQHKKPSDDLLDLSTKIVTYTKGLPLALIVLGSLLFGREVKEWKSALARLKKVPDNNIGDVLRISYDGLDNEQLKEIFLDIACLFKGKKIHRLKQLLDGFGYESDIGIQQLIEKSLITISGKDRVLMHDVLQALGWKIVREEHPRQPGKWSRLWQSNDIYRVLKENMGTHHIQCIKLNKPRKEVTVLDGKSFSNMRNLRLLKMSNVGFPEDHLEYLSNELRFLKWSGYPLPSLPSSFHPENLVELNLCNSNIQYLWNGQKSFKKLKTIKLRQSCKLIRTPDFKEVPNLEILDLEGCESLLEVHESVGRLKKLVVLNLKDCINLKSFPSSVHDSTSLMFLSLRGCSKLDRLPLDLGNAKELIVLDASRTAVRVIPSSIVGLENLKALFLHGCKRQNPQATGKSILSWLKRKRNPELMCLQLPSLTGLRALTALDLSDCNLSDQAVLIELFRLPSLEALDLRSNNFVTIPEGIKDLSRLKIFSLENNPRLSSLPPLLPPNLLAMGLAGCPSLKTLPSNLLQQCTSGNLTLQFFNCPRLQAENIDGNNNSADLFLRRWLQAFCNNYSQSYIHEVAGTETIIKWFEEGSLPDRSQFHIQLPGSEIPKWFTHRREGSTIAIRLPPDWLNNKLMGFALCAVFAIPAHYSSERPIEVRCNFRMGGTFGVSFKIPSFTSVETDHLWLGFWSQTMIPFISSSLNVQAGFFIAGDNEGGRRWNIPVKKCGIRLVYKDNIEYLGADCDPDELSETEGLMLREYNDDDMQGNLGVGYILETIFFNSRAKRNFDDGDRDDPIFGRRHVEEETAENSDGDTEEQNRNEPETSERNKTCKISSILNFGTSITSALNSTEHLKIQPITYNTPEA